MNKHEVTRRNFLRTARISRASSSWRMERSGPLRVRAKLGEGLSPNPLFLTEPRRFAPVKVARNRIIRTVVGLRPYRDEGFVVEAERLGNKLLVHNYGHGGAGVTLSWGTSSLAVDIARDHLQSRAALTISSPVCGARLRRHGTINRSPGPTPSRRPGHHLR